jgi:RNA-binding protein YlmH
MTHTSFLDVHEKALLEREAIAKKAVFALYGGYGGAERCVMLLFPDAEAKREWEEAGPGGENDPLEVLRVRTKKGAREMTHRDYLGSLMSLGIDRSLTGDILVGSAGENGQSADVVVLSEMAEYIAREYTSVGRETVTAERLPVGEIAVNETAFEEKKDTVASLRLDSVLGTAFALSRGTAQEAIRRGLVFVNSAEASKPDKLLAEGDKITLRGKGKAVLAEVGQKTKKDRIFIRIVRYR